MGRDDKQKQARHEDYEREQGFPDHLEVLAEAEQAQGAREREDEKGGELGRGPVDAHGDPGGLEGLAEGRQAVEEAQGGRGGDDNVRPGGRELHGGQGGQQDADGARHEGDRPEDEATDVEGAREEDGAEDAAEVGRPARGAVEQAVDAPEGGRGQGGRGLGELGGWVVGVRVVQVDGGVFWRLRVFYYRQSRIYVTKGVADLRRRGCTSESQHIHDSFFAVNLRRTKRHGGKAKMCRAVPCYAAHYCAANGPPKFV